jgi:hypothetical protein
MADWHCYCDETCTDKPHRYMAIGGVMIRVDEARRIRDDNHAWRRTHDMMSELKWQKVSKRKIAEYLYFAHKRLNDVKAKRFAFGALVLDRHKLDHAGYNRGEEITGQSKFLYQLILNRFIPLMSEGDKLAIFPDERRGHGDFGQLQGCLNSAIARKYRRQRNVVSKVMQICSKSTEVGQVNDLILGAVGFHANRKQQSSGTAHHKKVMAEYMAHLMGLPDLSTDTPFRMQWFHIWNFMLGERVKKGAMQPSRVSGPPQSAGP